MINNARQDAYVKAGAIIEAELEAALRIAKALLEKRERSENHISRLLSECPGYRKRELCKADNTHQLHTPGHFSPPILQFRKTQAVNHGDLGEIVLREHS